jgi:hypothetical protein
MGLILPGGPDWAYYSHNLTATIATGATTFGTQVASGTGSADGSAVTVLSALAHDCEYLRLTLGSATATAIDNNALMDILIDPAGGTSWSVLIPSLAVGGLAPITLNASGCRGASGGYDFPLWIPAGASIGARARNAGGTLQTVSVYALARGGNANPASWWCGQRVSALGIDAGNSRGTSHTCHATANTFSSWADLGSPLGAACGALQWAVMGTHTFSSSWAAAQFEFEFGVGGSRLGSPLQRAITASENGWWFPTGPIFKRLPAGAQLQCRGKASINSTAALSVAAYTVH